MNGEPSDYYVTQYVHKACGAEPTYDIYLKNVKQCSESIAEPRKKYIFAISF